MYIGIYNLMITSTPFNIGNFRKSPKKKTKS